MPVKDISKFAQGGSISKKKDRKKDHKKSKKKHRSEDEDEDRSEDDLLEGEEIDEEDSDEDDEEEEDDAENDNYEDDGFLVRDGEDDEEEPEIASVHSGSKASDAGLDEEKDEEVDERRKKKHKKRRESSEEEDLEEDLELIKENTAPQLRRLQKKVHTLIDDEEDDIIEPEIDEEGSFIEDDMPREDQQTKKRKRAPTENTSLLQQIFGTGYPEDEELLEEEPAPEGEEGEQAEEERKKLNKKKLEQIFDPSELQEKFETLGDEQIIQMDTPERLQYRYKGKLNEEVDLTLETIWIAEKLIREKGLIDKNTENFRKNILKVLEFLRIYSYEIMYIATYKINEISLKPGELKLPDLWKIYEYDLEFTGIWSRRKQIEKNLENLSRYEENVVPPYIISFFNTNPGDRFAFDNILEWCSYQTTLYADKAPQNISATQEEEFLKKAKASASFKPDLRDLFDRITYDNMISADRLASYILDPRTKQSPPHQDVMVKPKLEGLVNPEIRKISTWKGLIYSYRDYEVQKLFKNPIIRRVVQKMYLDKLIISTEPTAKGRKEIDIYNVNYPVKRIEAIPAGNFPEELWLRAVQCEKEGKINIKFGFRWKDFQTDEIGLYLKEFYLYDQKVRAETNTEWNLFRVEIIQELLKSYLYPFLEKHVRQDLTENAEKLVINECGKKFKEMINASPYTKANGDKNSNRITVISFVPDERDRVFCAVVDKDGIFKDFREYEFLLVRDNGPSPAPLEHIQKKDFEEKSLKNLIEKHNPDLLVVGADNLAAKRLREYLRNDKIWGNSPKVWVKYGDMTAPKIYAKLDISKKELGDYQVKLREAASLARLQQNPLAEILKLWHHKPDQNGLLFIHFHDLQNQVKRDKLLREFERVSMEVTNQVGIQINKLIKFPHLAAPLQFVCGLGPRKAKHVLDTLRSKVEKLLLRRELTEGCVGKLVFTNMAGFINNYYDPPEEEMDDKMKLLDVLEVDPLEITRIHPDNYRLAQKIAKDALDNSSSDDVVKSIMQNPKKLDELDLDDYAAHLDSKGKTNMKLILDFIVRELTYPFYDLRDSHKEMDDKELFFKMTKMHPFELQKGSIVNARITGVEEKFIKCKLECGVGGRIRGDDTDFPSDDLKKKYNIGEIVQARVKGNNFEEKQKINDNKKQKKEGAAPPDFTIIQLTIRKVDLDNHKNYISTLHFPNFEKVKQYFRIVDQEDFPQTQVMGNKTARYQPRKISHPKFKNTSVQGALDYLHDKDIGDYIIRPSSKGNDHLTITWKFFDKIYVHLDIKESQKTATEKIGRRLFLKDQQFESLDEIFSGYIEPCNNHVANITSNPKFMSESAEKIEESVKEEKETNQRLIPYRFGFSTEAPQFLVLYYAPKDYNIITEYIKVKQNGLSFHDNSFPSLPHLISWFKTNYSKPEYHKYLKHTKPPVAQQKQSIIPKTEKMSQNDYNMGSNTPVHLGAGYNDNIRVKHEKDIRVKTEKQGFNVKDEPRGYRDHSNDRHKGGRDGGRDRRDFRGGDRDKDGGRRKSRSRSNEKSRHGDRRGGDRGDRGDRERDRDSRGGYDRDRRRDDRGDRGDRGDNRGGDRRGGDDRRQGGPRFDKGDRRDSRPDNRRRDDGGGWGNNQNRGPPRNNNNAPVDAWGTEPGEQVQNRGGWGGPSGIVKQEDHRAHDMGQPRNDEMIRVKQEHH